MDERRLAYCIRAYRIVPHLERECIGDLEPWFVIFDFERFRLIASLRFALGKMLPEDCAFEPRGTRPSEHRFPLSGGRWEDSAFRASPAGLFTNGKWPGMLLIWIFRCNQV